MILPPTTAPRGPIRRVHRPKQYAGKRGYEKYRRCLRWEFGFTCSFCLLHESDFHVGLAAIPAAGSGLFTIEHLLARSTNPEATKLQA